MAKGKPRLTGIAAALLGMASGTGCASQADSSKMQVIAPIFSQLLVWQMPPGFHGANEQTHGRSYLAEAVPEGQDVDNWSQMVTVTGLADAALETGLTPKIIAQNLAAGFRDTCPNTYDGSFLDAPQVDGFDTFAALISCGSVPDPAHPRSETALVVVIKGTHDYYTVQWAERGDPQPGTVAADGSRWYARLHELMPIHLCDKVSGEQAPYPSCLARINGHAIDPSTKSVSASGTTSAVAFTEERSAATGFVGGLHYFVGRMASACRPILGEAESRPKELVDAWLQQGRNDVFYHATLRYMNAFLDWVKKREGEQGMKRALGEQFGSIHASSDKEVLQELIGDATAQAATCRRFESHVLAGDFNVPENTQHYTTLVNLARDLPPAD